MGRRAYIAAHRPTLLQTHLHSLPAASQLASGPCQSWRRRGASAVATDSAPRRCLIGVGDERGTCPPWSRCTKRGRPVRPVRPRSWPAVPGTGRHTTPHSRRCRCTQSAVFHSSCRWADPAPRPSWQSQTPHPLRIVPNPLQGQVCCHCHSMLRQHPARDMPRMRAPRSSQCTRASCPWRDTTRRIPEAMRPAAW